MVDSGRASSPLEGIVDAAGPRARDAFELLGDETRLAILLALWDAWDPHAEQNAVSFTELRDRVGSRQGGNFNYHLDRLVGAFVRKTDAGYALRANGLALVQSIIAGTGIEDPTLEPTEVDAACERCGAPTAITYENNRVYQVCTECTRDDFPGDEHPTGALIGWTFEPTGLSGRTAEEACPRCGRHDAIRARETCTVCKSSGFGSPGIKVLFHPAVVAFYYDHGIEVGFTGTTDFDDVVRTLDLVDGVEEEVVSADPPRVRVTMSRDGDELRLLLDERTDVVDVERD